jgi:hypothetical protein
MEGVSQQTLLGAIPRTRDARILTAQTVKRSDSAYSQPPMIGSVSCDTGKTHEAFSTRAPTGT